MELTLPLKVLWNRFHLGITIIPIWHQVCLPWLVTHVCCFLMLKSLSISAVLLWSLRPSFVRLWYKIIQILHFKHYEHTMSYYSAYIQCRLCIEMHIALTHCDKRSHIPHSRLALVSSACWYTECIYPLLRLTQSLPAVSILSHISPIPDGYTFLCELFHFLPTVFLQRLKNH